MTMPLASNATPAALGYSMPAEWEQHVATWIAWPHNQEDWPEKFEPIPWVYAEIVRYLHRKERVRICAMPEVQESARALLVRVGVDLSCIDFYAFPTDRVWLRDSGAILVRNAAAQRLAVNWRFNAWAKYDNWRNDERLGELMAKSLGISRVEPMFRDIRVVLEGGSIEVNGQGLLLTTEECLLSPIQARNPQLTKVEIEQVLCDYLGVSKILWLNSGIVGDDTHGHIDDLTRFVDARTVVTMVEPDKTDANHAPLEENLQRLRTMKDVEGRRLNVYEIPMPAPLYFDGQRLPASYANFYIANEVVLVPTFNDANDQRALSILGQLFPRRRVIGIHAVDLVWGLGTLHCLTQQEPA
jgi:agmatine deiminase